MINDCLYKALGTLLSIHTFYKSFLGTHCVTATKLDAVDTMGNKRDVILALTELKVQWWRQTLNIQQRYVCKGK